MLSKKIGLIFICLVATSLVIEISFKQSKIAHLVARALPLFFIIYFITQKDFKTRYPKAAEMRPQMIILIIALIGLTVYQYVLRQ